MVIRSRRYVSNRENRLRLNKTERTERTERTGTERVEERIEVNLFFSSI